MVTLLNFRAGSSSNILVPHLPSLSPVSAPFQTVTTEKPFLFIDTRTISMYVCSSEGSQQIRKIFIHKICCSTRLLRLSISRWICSFFTKSSIKSLLCKSSHTAKNGLCSVQDTVHASKYCHYISNRTK